MTRSGSWSSCAIDGGLRWWPRKEWHSRNSKPVSSGTFGDFYSPLCHQFYSLLLHVVIIASDCFGLMVGRLHCALPFQMTLVELHERWWKINLDSWVDRNERRCCIWNRHMVRAVWFLVGCYLVSRNFHDTGMCDICSCYFSFCFPLMNLQHVLLHNIKVFQTITFHSHSFEIAFTIDV